KHAQVERRCLVSQLALGSTQGCSRSTQRLLRSTLDTSRSTCEIQLKTRRLRPAMASQEQRHFVDAVFGTEPWRPPLGRQLVGDSGHVEKTLNVKMLSQLDVVDGQGMIGIDVIYLACYCVRREYARGEGALAARQRRRAAQRQAPGPSRRSTAQLPG